MNVSVFLLQDNLIGTLLAIFGNVLVSISLSIQVQTKKTSLNVFISVSAMSPKHPDYKV